MQGIVDPATAVSAARDVNDRLASEVARRPDRYAGFASIAVQDPDAAAIELERAVTRLGFKGAMINGYTNTRDWQRVEYLDEPRFLPFWEAAAALGVPIYLHPRPALDQRIFQGHSELIGATWGFAPEAATHALRLVYSGLFDRLPSLTVILGHLGETLPYFSWRIQHCFEYNPSDKRVERRLQDYLVRQLLCVDERLLERPGAHRRDVDDWCRPDPVCLRLSLRDDGAGGALDRARGDQRGGSKKNSRRQCAAAIQDSVIVPSVA